MTIGGVIKGNKLNQVKAAHEFHSSMSDRVAQGMRGEDFGNEKSLSDVSKLSDSNQSILLSEDESQPDLSLFISTGPIGKIFRNGVRINFCGLDRMDTVGEIITHVGLCFQESGRLVELQHGLELTRIHLFQGSPEEHLRMKIPTMNGLQLGSFLDNVYGTSHIFTGVKIDPNGKCLAQCEMSSQQLEDYFLDDESQRESMLRFDKLEIPFDIRDDLTRDPVGAPLALRRTSLDVTFASETPEHDLSKYFVLESRHSYKRFSWTPAGALTYEVCLKGSKIFLFQKISEGNIGYIFNLWSGTATEEINPALIKNGVLQDCFAIMIREGNAIMYPGKWIVATYTPEDYIGVAGFGLAGILIGDHVRVNEFDIRLEEVLMRTGQTLVGPATYPGLFKSLNGGARRVIDSLFEAHFNAETKGHIQHIRTSLFAFYEWLEQNKPDGFELLQKCLQEATAQVVPFIYDKDSMIRRNIGGFYYNEGDPCIVKLFKRMESINFQFITRNCLMNGAYPDGVKIDANDFTFGQLNSGVSAVEHAFKMQLITSNSKYQLRLDESIPKDRIILEVVGCDMSERQVLEVYRGVIYFGNLIPVKTERNSFFYKDLNRMGNAAIFVNHSDDPNCVIRTLIFDNSHRVFLMSKKHLNAGDLLTRDLSDHIGMSDTIIQKLQDEGCFLPWAELPQPLRATSPLPDIHPKRIPKKRLDKLNLSEQSEIQTSTENLSRDDIGRDMTMADEEGGCDGAEQGSPESSQQRGPSATEEDLPTSSFNPHPRPKPVPTAGPSAWQSKKQLSNESSNEEKKEIIESPPKQTTQKTHFKAQTAAEKGPRYVRPKKFHVPLTSKFTDEERTRRKNFFDSWNKPLKNSLTPGSKEGKSVHFGSGRKLEYTVGDKRLITFDGFVPGFQGGLCNLDMNKLDILINKDFDWVNKLDQSILGGLDSNVLLGIGELRVNTDLVNQYFYNTWEYNRVNRFLCQLIGASKTTCSICPLLRIDIHQRIPYDANNDKSNRNKHFHRFHNADPYRCEVCALSFATQKALDDHNKEGKRSKDKNNPHKKLEDEKNSKKKKTNRFRKSSVSVPMKIQKANPEGRSKRGK